MLLASTALAALLPGLAMAQSLEIEGAGASQTISDAQSVDRLVIDEGGKLTVSAGGSLSMSGNAFIGGEGQGTLDITDGGAVEVLSQTAFVGSAASGSGIVNVSGVGSNLVTAPLLVGLNGVGVLNVSNQGVVDALSLEIGESFTGTGTVLVTGTGSKVLSELNLIVGERGEGELIVADGGVVEVGGVFKLAEFSSGSGTLLIGNTTAGAAGHIQGADGAAAEIQFGEGAGVVQFNHTETDYVFNANVSGAGDFVHDAGTTTLSGTNDIEGDVIVNGGALNVTGDTAAAGATIGTGAGSNGTLNVVDGGTLNIGGTATIGRDDASFGKVTVAGAGSRLDATILRVGDDGIGQLLLDDGGLAVGNFVEIGSGGDGNGRVILEGLGTLLQANDLNIGTTGTAALELREGASVEVRNTLRLAQDASSIGELIIGADEGEAAAAAGDLVDTDGGRVGIQLGNGDATIYFNHTDMDYAFNADVSGNGEIQHIAGTTTFGGVIDIGTGGLFVDGGELIITNRTSAQTATLDGADARLTVTGPDGQLTVADSMSVGLGTSGALRVIDGAGVDIINNLLIGVVDGADGEVEVSGAGSSLVVSEDLVVGHEGTGEFFLTDEGHVTVGNALIIGRVGNGQMVIDSGSTATVLGAVTVGDTGVGELLVRGGGVLQATGDITVGLDGELAIGGGNGDTAAAAGLVQDENGDAATIFLDGGLLVLNHTADDLDFNADILGDGSISHRAGSTHLTGDLAALTGAAVVTGGTLAVDTGLGGSAVAKSGGTLTGTGTVGGTVLFETGSTYQADIAATEFLKSNALVDIQAGATLSVVSNGALALPIGTAKTVLTGGTLTGTFDTIAESLLYLDADVTYDANAVTLTLTRNGVSFADAAQSDSQASIGKALDALDTDSPLYNAIVALDSAEAAQDAFEQLSGEVHASTTGSLVQGAGAMRSIVGTRTNASSSGGGSSDDMFMAYFPVATASQADANMPDWDSVIDVPATPMFESWGQAYGAFGQVAATGGSAGMTSREGGLVLGVEAPDFNGFTAGILAGIGLSGAQVDDLSSSASVTNYTIGAYAGRDFGGVRTHLGSTVTVHAIDATRDVAIGGFTDTLTAKYGAATFQTFGEVGYLFETGATQIEPYAGLAVIHQVTEGFTEVGGSAALRVDSASSTLGVTTLGVRGSAEVGQLSGGQTVSVNGGIAWRHAFGDVATSGTAQFASGGPSFTTDGAPIDQDTLLVEAGMRIDLTSQAALSATYRGEFGQSASNNAVSARLGVKF